MILSYMKYDMSIDGDTTGALSQDRGTLIYLAKLFKPFPLFCVKVEKSLGHRRLIIK